MDEVDGMSAGDRGGVGALNALIKKSKVVTVISIGSFLYSPLHQVPIICIANDKQSTKLRPLLSTTFNLSFSKCVLGSTGGTRVMIV